jgi:hypothetical protein
MLTTVSVVILQDAFSLNCIALQATFVGLEARQPLRLCAYVLFKVKQLYHSTEEDSPPPPPKQWYIQKDDLLKSDTNYNYNNRPGCVEARPWN